MADTTPIEHMARRRAEVGALLASGSDVRQIVSELPKRGITNPKTGKPYGRTTIINDLKALPNKDQVSEIIGRWTYVKPIWPARVLLNVDRVWNDLVFWDTLRRGKAEGYEIGGLYCLPIAQTVCSYVMGDGVSALLLPGVDEDDDENLTRKPQKKGKKGRVSQITPQPSKAGPNKPGNGSDPNQPTTDPNNPNAVQPAAPPMTRAMMEPAKQEAPPPTPVDFTNAAIRRFFERNQALIQMMVIDLFCLGDQYIIINPDTSLSIASPETVTVEYSPSDMREAVRYTIRTRYDKAIVIDTYTAEKRTVDIQYYSSKVKPVHLEYENLIGRIPIVHFANDRSTNEIYGRPIYEALLPVFRKIDDLLLKTVDGVEMIGNPIPVFEGMEDVESTIKNNSDDVPYTDYDGSTQTRRMLRVDRQAGFFIGKDGKFHFAGPAVGFSKDAIDVNKELFMLIMHHTRIPQFMWGGAIASSKASAETQLPPYIQYIKFRRLMLEGEGADSELGLRARNGLLELLDLWLRTYQLLNPSIVVGPCSLEWPEIDIQNDLVKFQWIQYLNMAGYIDGEDAVKQSGYFEDPAATVAKAKGESYERPDLDEFSARLDEDLLDAAHEEAEPQEDEQERYLFPFASQTDITLPAPNNNSFSLVGPAGWWGGP